jgi:hypothetical protein
LRLENTLERSQQLLLLSVTPRSSIADSKNSPESSGPIDLLTSRPSYSKTTTDNKMDYCIQSELPPVHITRWNEGLRGSRCVRTNIQSLAEIGGRLEALYAAFILAVRQILGAGPGALERVFREPGGVYGQCFKHMVSKKVSS